MDICTACGNSLSENAKFCRHCGKRTSVCNTCGAALLPDSKFCEECGAIVVAAQPNIQAVNSASQTKHEEVQTSTAPSSNTSTTPLPTATYGENALLRNPKTGEIKQIKVGWSWTIFFFDWLALFIRQMYPWAVLFLVFFAVNLLFRSSLAIIPMLCIEIGVKIYLCIKGNELMAKQLLENGWEFAEPESATTRYAKIHWGLETALNTSQAVIESVSSAFVVNSGNSVENTESADMDKKEDNFALLLIVMFGAATIFILICFCLTSIPKN
jgi:ribosomal protein L40E